MAQQPQSTNMFATSIGGIPLHRFLVNVPIGCFVAATLFDILALSTGNAVFYTVSFYVIGLAILGGLLAAAVGIADWLKVPQSTPEKKIAFNHGWIMAATIVCYIYSFLLRYNTPADPAPGSVGIALFGFALLALGAHKGGMLTTKYGLGTWFSKTRSDQSKMRPHAGESEQDELAKRRKEVRQLSDEDDRHARR